jgi:hypothetical protein
MAKRPMRVITRPGKHTRYVKTGRHAGSSLIGSGTEGDYTYVCGKCRDILWDNIGPDFAFQHIEDDEENFIPVLRVRDVVVKCKGCGAYNEIPGQP